MFSRNTFSIGIVNSAGKILSNVNCVYKPEKGGIVPREAMAHHVDVVKKVIEKSLKEAGVSLRDIDIFCFSAGPGMPPCLRVGSVTARTLSLKYNKPIVPVNHSVAHIEIAKLFSGFTDPMILYVSGGNTQILGKTGPRYRIFGEAIDIPIGNCFDQFAREIGIPHPGGPRIEELAKKGKWVNLPYVVKGMDTSFSGILTSAIEKYKEGVSKEDICFSLQEVCFSMLTEVSERALSHTGKKELILTGGVGANSRLQQMLRIMCEERNARFFAVPKNLASDNGAMIAWTGILSYQSGQRFDLDSTKINRFWRVDQVEAPW